MEENFASSDSSFELEIMVTKKLESNFDKFCLNKEDNFDKNKIILFKNNFERTLYTYCPKNLLETRLISFHNQIKEIFPKFDFVKRRRLLPSYEENNLCKKYCGELYFENRLVGTISCEKNYEDMVKYRRKKEILTNKKTIDTLCDFDLRGDGSLTEYFFQIIGNLIYFLNTSENNEDQELIEKNLFPYYYPGNDNLICLHTYATKILANLFLNENFEENYYEKMRELKNLFTLKSLEKKLNDLIPQLKDKSLRLVLEDFRQNVVNTEFPKGLFCITKKNNFSMKIDECKLIARIRIKHFNNIYEENMFNYGSYNPDHEEEDFENMNNYFQNYL